jgi:hypothetical protein
MRFDLGREPRWYHYLGFVLALLAILVILDIAIILIV